MKTRLLTLAAATILTSASLLASDSYAVDKSHSDVTFSVRHLVSRSTGNFRDFAGKLNLNPASPKSSSVEFVVKTASIDTDNEDRDKHLRSADFFDAEKHPEIVFKSSSIKPAGRDKYKVTGTLNLHGVSRVVTIPVTFLGFAKDPWGNEKAGFETELTLNRKDFGIVWNKALDNGGALLGEDVKLTINLETNKVKEPAAGK